jgi:hypothetical protein
MFTSSNSTQAETLHYTINDSKPHTMQIYETNFLKNLTTFMVPYETQQIYTQIFLYTQVTR